MTQSKPRRHSARVLVAVLTSLCLAQPLVAEEDPPTTTELGTSSSSADANNTNTNSASPTAQVVVQSITGSGSQYRMTPNAPSMPSFAGGPCIGTSATASGAIPGISFGAGVSKEDASCQRRNWVQTLIGASEHLTPEDGVLMKRLAFEVMREDEYLAGPFQRLGLGLPTEADEKAVRKSTQNAKPAAKPAKKAAARFDTGCVVVVASSAPAGIAQVLGKRGCRILKR